MKSGRKTGMRVLAMLLALALGTASLWTGTSAHASAPEAYVPEAAAVHEMEVEVPKKRKKRKKRRNKRTKKEMKRQRRSLKENRSAVLRLPA